VFASKLQQSAGCSFNIYISAIVNQQLQFLEKTGHTYCYDLNFAVNRKGENVLEHSRTGSRTPTSGTGRVSSARGGENI
jgi:hypothetical protein